MNSHFDRVRKDVDGELRRIFESRGDIPEKLLESMRYSIFAGGKRLRPFLVIAAAEAVGGDGKAALPTAAAFEIIHTYTLIHDDLPAMDDDDLRRGMPTNHIKFGEATAILAGDGLLTLAFEVMAETPSDGAGVRPETMIKVVRTVAKAVGAQGTVGGQQVDIEYEGKKGELSTLEYIHSKKTGAMITAAVECGGLIGGATEGELKSLSAYGEKIGLAFQIVDDILDVVGETEKLGKKAGADQDREKMTYPSLLGLDESRALAEKLIKESIESLNGLGGNAAPLADLARYVGERNS